MTDRDPLYRAIAAISLVLGVIGIWAALIAWVLGVW